MNSEHLSGIYFAMLMCYLRARNASSRKYEVLEVHEDAEVVIMFNDQEWMLVILLLHINCFILILIIRKLCLISLYEEVRQPDINVVKCSTTPRTL